MAQVRQQTKILTKRLTLCLGTLSASIEAIMLIFFVLKIYVEYEKLIIMHNKIIRIFIFIIANFQNQVITSEI